VTLPGVIEGVTDAAAADQPSPVHG